MFKNPVATVEQLSVWLNSGDSMMVQLAKDCLGLPLPEEKELIDILTFFSIFAIGCKEMKLGELSEVFEKRANLFVLGLAKMGFSASYRREYVLKRSIPGPLLRIQRRAFGRATYIMTELNRDVILPQPEKIRRKK